LSNTTSPSSRARTTSLCSSARART
jgi:hypothetical protein